MIMQRADIHKNDLLTQAPPQSPLPAAALLGLSYRVASSRPHPAFSVQSELASMLIGTDYEPYYQWLTTREASKPSSQPFCARTLTNKLWGCDSCPPTSQKACGGTGPNNHFKKFDADKTGTMSLAELEVGAPTSVPP